MKNHRNHLRIPAWLCSVLALTTAARAQHEVKVPHTPPVVEDIKTPAPTPSRGESRIRPVPARPADLPAVSATKPAPRADATLRRRFFEHVQVAEPGDGAIWARGTNYKARFGGDGVTFVPFFGSKAETDHPVRFSLVAARVGECALELDTTVAPRSSGEQIEFERGAVVERWRLALDEVEQQFVIASLATSGDLVLEIGVETDLVLDSARDDGRVALSFGCALGHVEYGVAVAIDADGRRFPLATSWTGTTIELRLDRSALHQARFPLVIDPIVSTMTFDPSLADSFAPDTAYEAATDTYVMVNEEAFSATDHDVFVLHVNAAGILLYGGHIDYTTDDWRHPKVASNALAQNFLCVAAVTPFGGGVRRIRGATFASATSTPGAQFTISGSEPGDKLNPDVGGDPSLGGPTYYMVVWQRSYSPSDQDIHARLVQPSGTTAGGVVFVDNSSSTLDTVPAISKSDGHPPFSTQVWTIVWQHFYFGTQEQIFGAQYRWDGTLIHATFPIDLGDDCLAPSVSSPLDGDAFSPRTYMVSFQVKGQLQTQWDIIGAIFVGTQFYTGTDIGNQISLATLSNDQVHPRVDCDGQHFSVTFAQEFAGGFYDWDIFVADVIYAAGYPWVCAWDTFAYTSLQELSPSITSTYSGNGARRRYLAAWDVLDQFTVGAVREVWTGLWDGCEGGFASRFCAGDGTATACPCANSGAAGNGCGNFVNAGGADLWYAGNPWIGNDSFTLLGSGMPNGPALYYQGNGVWGSLLGLQFGNGLRCVGGTTTRLGIKFNVGGASQFPEPGDPTISSYSIMLSTGSLFYYQVWYRDDASFCTASGFNFSNGLRAIWAP